MLREGGIGDRRPGSCFNASETGAHVFVSTGPQGGRASSMLVD